MAATAPKQLPKTAKPLPVAVQSKPAKTSTKPSSTQPGLKTGTKKLSSKFGTKKPQQHAFIRFLLWPFRTIRHVFTSDVKLKLQGMNVHVKLVNSEAPPAPVIKSKEQRQFELMSVALEALLNSHPQTRRVMRHLVFFETAFLTGSGKLAADVPVDVLKEALRQLESLVTDWSNRGLEELRSFMLFALVERTQVPTSEAAEAPVSEISEFPVDLTSDARLDVIEEEFSHSQFVALDDAYQGRTPAVAPKKIIVDDFPATQLFEPDELPQLNSDGTFEQAPSVPVAVAPAVPTPDPVLHLEPLKWELFEPDANGNFKLPSAS